MTRRLSLVLMFVLSTLPESEAQSQEGRVFRISSDLAVIDMVPVDRDGRFLDDLRIEEVEVRENGKRRDVKLLQLVSRAGVGRTTTSISDAPPPSTSGADFTIEGELRRVIVAVDTLGIQPEVMPRLRQALLAAIQETPVTSPTMVVAVGRAAQAPQTFTTDPSALVEAISSSTNPVARFPSVSTVFEAVDRVCAAASDPLRVMRAAIDAGERLLSDTNDRSAAASRALIDLLAQAATYAGRKHVVLYSAGYAIDPERQITDAIASAVAGCSGIDPTAARREAAAALRSLSRQTVPSDLRHVIEEANRAHIAFYTANPGGLVGDVVMPQARGSSQSRTASPLVPVSRLRDDAGRDYLSELAKATGGLSLISNDPGTVLRRAVDDASQYFLIGYVAGVVDAKETTRKIAVQITRRGAVARFRSGYIDMNDVRKDQPGASSQGEQVQKPSTTGFSREVERGNCCTTASASNRLDEEVQVLLALAAKYVDDFVGLFSNIVVDEKMVQLFTKAPSRSWNGRLFTPGTTIRRRLLSEFLLVRPPGTVFWLPFRDVIEVDGRSVADRSDRLVALFEESGAAVTSQAAEIAAAGAVHQLGPRRRGFRDPVVALAFLQAHHRQRFRYGIDKRTAAGSASNVMLKFFETSRPTLLQDDDGRDVPLKGSFEIDRTNGTIRRSELAIQTVNESILLRTTFVFNELLHVNIPAEMIETYSMKDGARLETMAHYERFRSFGVSTSTTYK